MKKLNFEEIESIEYIGEEYLIDIEVDGDHMFMANGILTHNSGFNNSNPGMENTGESIAIPQTADTMIIIKRNSEYDIANQVEAKIAKSRFSKNETQTLLGVNYELMNIYDLGYTEGNHVNDSINRAKMRRGIPDTISDFSDEIE